MSGAAVEFRLLPLSSLKPHEATDPDHVAELADRIAEDGVIFKPIVVDRGTRVVLDGHHRHGALSALACRLAPCHVVDYNDPGIRVERWEDGTPMDKDELIDHALTGELMPIKTSRHRTLRALPPEPTRLTELRPGKVDA